MIINLNKWGIDFVKDGERIKKICLSYGYAADIADCMEIWEECSEEWDAGWLILPDEDEKIWKRIEDKIITKSI